MARPEHQTCVAPPRPARIAHATRAYPAATFDEPVSLTLSPDHAWWFVGERRGRVWRLDATDEMARPELVLDFSSEVDSSTGAIGLLAIALHPRFATNGELFASYTAKGGTLAISRVTRFRSKNGGRSFTRQHELLALDQISDYHVNTDLRFGPDGYLYAGFGDGGPQGDPHGRAQDRYSLKGKLLRLDVDARKPYGIPPTNPFAHGGGAPEVWAFGLRNPWRFAFDRETGALWAGDVGEDRLEEIDHIIAGGNYGWPMREGMRCTRPAACASVSTIDPLVELPHPTISSVTFGAVYRGSRFPELAGHLIYADYASGTIWSVDPEQKPPKPRMLVDGGHAIATFAEEANGEIIAVDLAGTLWRLDIGASGTADVPALLSETGCFGPRGVPVAGLIPYEVNASFWSDGAGKRRWFAIPDGTHIDFDREGHLDLPIGSIVAKEFSVGGLRVETRLMIRHDEEWTGYTYRWDASQRDATLVPEAAAGFTSPWPKPWYFPHRGECSRCHQGAAGHVLGLEVAQLDRAVGDTNQLALFDRIGLFASEIPATPALQDKTVEQRARTWLHVNCSYCHRPGATGLGDMDLRYTTPLAQMNVCDVPPRYGTFDKLLARRIAPGDPSRSVLLRRMKALGFLRMPPLGTLGTDPKGIEDVSRWIEQLSCN